MKHLCLLLLLICSIEVDGFGQTISFTLENVPVVNAGSTVGIRGNIAPLSWEKSVIMKEIEDGVYESAINFVDASEVAYKYVIENEGKVIWELGTNNRSLDIKTGDISDKWDRVTPPSAAMQLTPEQVQEDFDVLKKALLGLHPGIYRYNTPEEFDRSLENLRVQMLESPDQISLYRSISKFLATIQCGHTYANFYNQSPEIKALLNDKNDKLPFATTWLNGKWYITGDASSYQLDPGTEILSIDGISSSEILHRLMPYVKSDGSNDGKRIYDLGIHLNDRYETFDIYFPLEFPQPDGSVICRVQLPDGEEKELEVTLVEADQRRAVLSERFDNIPATSEDTWRFEMLNKETGYLKLGTFAIWNFEMDWKKFIRTAFADLRKEKVPNLIIDIRGNEGGADEVMAMLGKNLMDYSCGIKAFETRVRYQKLPSELEPFVGTWDKRIYDISDAFSISRDGFYVNDNEDKIERIPGSSKAYEGNVYVIIDQSNSSSTMLLSRYVKECRLATLVGQPTGGSLKGINGGNMFFVNLPHSSIEFDIPVYGMFDDSAPAGGVQPDVVVSPTREDLINGNDPYISAILKKVDNP